MATEDSVIAQNLYGGRFLRSTARIQYQKVKYQIFISSTFRDLTEERQAISRSVLELNHIPSGMELFPAFDQAQLDFIKRVIDDCDYYVLIVGGKYGSITPEGISFTEAEYDYAVEKEKPVIALLHADIGRIPSEKVEPDRETREKLERFRGKISKGRLVKYWNDINDLKSNAIISLTAAFSDIPRIGWRRNDGLESASALARMEKYREEIDFLRKAKDSLSTKLREYEEMRNAEIDINYLNSDGPAFKVVSSDDLIREFGAPLKNGFDRTIVAYRLKSLIHHRYDSDVQQIAEEAIDNVVLFFEVFEVAERVDVDRYSIRQDKLHLLKAAFLKRKNENDGVSALEDEIPF